MRLEFSQIHNGIIFDSEFDDLKKNNGTIEFKRQNHAKGGMAVVYAPNGTGKSSLASVLGNLESTDELYFRAIDDSGAEVIPESASFHVIADQIQRNIIQGDESQYLVGKEIRREYELKKKVGKGFDHAFKEMLPSVYKSNYGVSKVKDLLMKHLQSVNADGYKYIVSIVNRTLKGDDIDRAEFISFIQDPANKCLEDTLDDDKRQFIIQDCSKTGIVDKLLTVNLESVTLTPEIRTIEQHDDAIVILRKYHALNECIVCDNNDFNGDKLLKQKEDGRKKIYDSLDKNTKDLLDKAAMEPSLQNNDPFAIKKSVMDFIENGDPTNIKELIVLLRHYVSVICCEMVLQLVNCFDGTTMLKDFDELSKLQEATPKLDSDDLLFIQEVISENIDRDIKIIRTEDNDRNFKLMLGDAPLLNISRDNMRLSTGEQNFISLAFELLLAKNGNKEYIVIDDPISSFDSIYKNKIAYCMLKFLENKKQIILTHNVDLIRLLDVQLKDCFNLYIMSNTDGGQNGFIHINDEEKRLLINLSDLVDLLHDKDGKLKSAIRDRRKFLISMVPFIRGYAHISLDPCDYFGKLSQIMHGYENATVDLVRAYNCFFGNVFSGTENVSTSDILAIDCNDLDFFDASKYPLLSETLRQSLIYYYLRMKVEKKLVDIFAMNIKDNDIVMLHKIILKAFSCSESDPEYEYKRACRVFFTSRKTLLNEFNHFEGNMNIFQPAIDINPVKLKKEFNDIEEKLAEIEEKYCD